MVVNPTIFPTSFDPHFKVFHELMPFKVQEILLVSSLYDAYIMEEDGSITTRLIHEYHGLNLSKAPRVTRVSTGEEAFAAIEAKKYDLVMRLLRANAENQGYIFGGGILEVMPHLVTILVDHATRAIDFDEAAAKQGVPISDISSKYADAYHADMAAIGSRLPDIEPRATDHIEQMIVMIQRLIDDVIFLFGRRLTQVIHAGLRCA